MRRPSGEKANQLTPSGASVSCTGSPLPAPSTYTWGGSPGAARRKPKALPSGLYFGAVSRKPRVSRRGRAPGVSGTRHSCPV